MVVRLDTKANLEFGLKDNTLKDEFTEYLKGKKIYKNLRKIIFISTEFAQEFPIFI